MPDAVREQLGQLIAEHGRSLCSTPRVISMMLRQQSPDEADAIHDLELALSHHCVSPMLTSLPELADAKALTTKLIDATGISEDRARWAIESWVAALSRERPESSGLSRDWSEWNRLEVQSSDGAPLGSYRRSVYHLLVVTAFGAFGGTTLGWITLLKPDFLGNGPWSEAVTDLPTWAHGLSIILLGALGGGTGGLLGWIFAGGRSWTYAAYGTTTLGRLWYSATGAYGGANVGVLCGLALMGLMGATLGGILGAGFGAWLGLMTAERISRFWWW